MPDVVRRVVVATGNVGKVAEIRAALDIAGWEFVTAREIGCIAPDVEETGDTFLDNALLKARAYAAACGCAALADDSGLEVDALGGEPGVHTAYYAGDDASDEDNNAKLLGAIADVAPAQRTARFRCTMVFLDEVGRLTTAEGTCEGTIGKAPVGSGGFGYDPLFVPRDGGGLTMAELPMDAKNAISHRGAALRALRTKLLESEAE